MVRNFLIHFPNQRGFSLLEILLALAVLATIVIMSINRFQHYQQHMQTNAIKNDIDIISQTLEHYFYTQGCNNAGIFNGKQHPSLSDLGITISSRAPVNAYNAYVINSQTFAANKPIYLLVITAALNINLSAAQVNWYGQVLNAQKIDLSQYQLTWQTTPNNRLASPHDYWVLAGQRAVFRRIQNGLTQSLGNHYCAQ